LILHSRMIKSPLSEIAFGIAHMDPYRLFVYSDDGRLLGPAMVIQAANDAEAIAQAEIVRGPLAAVRISTH
jgi:hypothetical protein